MHNNCAETDLGGGVMSPFVSLLSAIAQAHDPTVITSVALRKGPQRFCPYRSDRCLALMLTCQNSPLWQGFYAVIMSSFWPPWLTWTWYLISVVMTCINWNEPLWTTLEYELVDANGVCQGIQKVRVEHATRSVVATWCNVITSLHSW